MFVRGYGWRRGVYYFPVCVLAGLTRTRQVLSRRRVRVQEDVARRGWGWRGWGSVEGCYLRSLDLWNAFHDIYNIPSNSNETDINYHLWGVLMTRIWSHVFRDCSESMNKRRERDNEQMKRKK